MVANAEEWVRACAELCLRDTTGDPATLSIAAVVISRAKEQKMKLSNVRLARTTGTVLFVAGVLFVAAPIWAADGEVSAIGGGITMDGGVGNSCISGCAGRGSHRRCYPHLWRI